MRMSEIQQQIGRGEYRVDSHAVAEAIVRRLLHEHKPPARGHERPQVKCS